MGRHSLWRIEKCRVSQKLVSGYMSKKIKVDEFILAMNPFDQIDKASDPRHSGEKNILILLKI